MFNVTIGRAEWEACSATWNLGTNSVLGPRKTTTNLNWVGWSQDLPDANWLLASSPALTQRALTLVPICIVAYFFFFLFPFLFLFSTSCFLQLFLCAYDFGKHQTVYTTCGRNKRIYEQICIQIYISYMMKEAGVSCETLVPIYQPTRCQNKSQWKRLWDNTDFFALLFSRLLLLLGNYIVQSSKAK
jgi:hypothetical protein